MAHLSPGGRTPRAGWHSRNVQSPELVYRTTCPLVRPVPPPAPRIIHNTVHQTVIHLHQATHRHIRSWMTAGSGGRRPALLVRQAAPFPGRENAMDPSRPVRTARRLLRILSTESVRRTMLPFYQEMFKGFREQADRREKPFRPLPAEAVLDHRFYRRIGETLAGTILHSTIFRRYVRITEQTGEHVFLCRYAARELPVPSDLCRLPAALRIPPAPEPPAQAPAIRPAKGSGPPKPAGTFRLDDAGLRLLTGRVAEELGRQSRLESLRLGGI